MGTETVRTGRLIIEVDSDDADAARTSGKAWGEQEAELWKDQSDKPMPEWTMGTYTGRVPGEPWHEDEDEARDIREALEYIIDCAARDAWKADVLTIKCDDCGKAATIGYRVEADNESGYDDYAYCSDCDPGPDRAI